MNKCLQCDNQIKQVEGKKSRLYCDDKCRMAYNRGKSEQVKSEQIKSEQPNPNTRELTPNEKSGSITKNVCHGCGDSVSDLVCICLKCTTQGITHQSLGIDISKCD